VSENDFHDQVLAALSDLNVHLAEANGELKAVVARMDKHAAAIAQHQTGLYPHPHHHSQEGPDALQVAGLARVPREFIGFLVGKRAQDHIELLDMFFPADQKEYVTEGEVTMAGHWWTLAMEYAAELKMIVLESAHTLHLLGRARRSGSDSQHRRHGVLGGAGSDLRHCQCRRGIGPQEEVRRHRLVRPAQQLRRDRAVNATADVQNAMVLGFCRLCLLVAGGAPWAIPCPGGGCRGYPGGRGGTTESCGAISHHHFHTPKSVSISPVSPAHYWIRKTPQSHARR
jgi:hypothetical protein